MECFVSVCRKAYMLEKLIAVLPALVLTACADASHRPATPTAPSSVVASSSMSSGRPDAATGLVFCALAVRSPSGRYRTKTVPVHVPREIFRASGRTVIFGIRGWIAGSPDPVRLAQCEIPDTVAAAEWFKRAFGVGRGPIAASAAQAGSASAFSTSTANTDDGVTIYDVAGDCDPYAIVDYDCGCVDGSCDGWEDGGEEWEGPPPSEPEQPEFTLDAGTISCWGQTDYPHRSSTVPSNANVHARTGCPVLLPISVTLSLQRWSCFWVICWWSTVGSNYAENVAFQVGTNAAGVCKRGWYRGRAYHTAVLPDGTKLVGNTANVRYLFC
jgi:hypothetical protein